MLTRRKLVVGGAAAVLAPAAAGQAAAGGELHVSDIGHALVAAAIDGEACLALLDNGYNPSAIDADFAIARGLAGRQSVTINGAAARRTQDLSVRIGPISAMLSAAMLDMTHVAPVSGERVRLIAGRDLLSQMIVTLDFERRRYLMQRPDEPFAAQKGAVLLPLGESQDRWQTVRVGVEDRTLQAGVDLGLSAPLLLRESEQTRGWIDGGRRWSTAATAIPRGGDLVIAARKVTRAQRMTIGMVRFGEMPVEIYPADDPVFGGCEAIIGAPLLGRFVTTLDVSGSRLWLKAGAATGVRFHAPTVGLGTRVEGGVLSVLHVAANSPAERARIVAGDVVARLNGTKPNRDVLRLAQPGETVMIELASGRLVKLVAQEYY